MHFAGRMDAGWLSHCKMMESEVKPCEMPCVVVVLGYKCMEAELVPGRNEWILGVV